MKISKNSEKKVKDKDKEIEALKAEIEDLKQQLQARDAEPAIDNAINSGLIKASEKRVWMKIAGKLSTDEFKDMISLVDGTFAAKKNKALLSDFKAGKITAGEYEAKFNK